MSNIYDLLKGGDLRSLGKASEVVNLVTSRTHLFEEVFNGIFHEDKIIRARSADVIEKVARRYPAMIQKKKSVILRNLDSFKQKEVIWHIALMTGMMNFSRKELEKVTNQLMLWLSDSGSIIVKVACLQALAEQALKNKYLIKSVCDEINRQMIFGSPAIKARGRHLLKKMNMPGISSVQ